MKPSKSISLALSHAIVLVAVGFLQTGCSSVQGSDALFRERDFGIDFASVPLNKTGFGGLLPISLTVRDQNQRPTNGIIVSVKGLSNNLSITQFTNKSGALFFNLPKGTYEFTLSSNPIGKKTKTVRTISQGENLLFTYASEEDRQYGRTDLMLLGLLLSGALLQMSFSTSRNRDNRPKNRTSEKPRNSERFRNLAVQDIPIEKLDRFVHL